VVLYSDPKASTPDIWMDILGQRDRLFVLYSYAKRECIEHSMQFSEKLGKLHHQMWW